MCQRVHSTLPVIYVDLSSLFLPAYLYSKKGFRLNVILCNFCTEIYRYVRISKPSPMNKKLRFETNERLYSRNIESILTHTPVQILLPVKFQPLF